MKKIKRPKALWGSLVNAGIGIATNLISAGQQKDALDELNLKKKQNELARNSAITSQNLTAGYSNSQSYADDLLKRISYAGGGTVNNISDVINGISNGANTLIQGNASAYNTRNTYLENGMAGSITKKDAIEEPDYKKNPQFITANNTNQINNLPVKDKQNIDINDLNNIKPTTIVNNPYRFTPMQLFRLGGFI